MRKYLLAPVLLLLAGCGTAASGSTPSPTSTAQTHWSHPPPMSINPAHRYTATLVTSDGTMTVQLLPGVAPVTVNNFVFLARRHFYNGQIFHRIIRGYMAQTGDPTGTGFGGPGYQFKNERVTMSYTPGTLAMANHGPNTNGSQFFIVTGPAGQQTLQPQYTIFGRVSAGMSVLAKLDATPVGQNPASGELSSPLTDVYLKSVTIHESR